jgi:hypothetical protein
MRADGLARTVADFRRFRILADGMRTVRLKSGAGKPQMKTGPERAETRRRYALARPCLVLCHAKRLAAT